MATIHTDMLIKGKTGVIASFYSTAVCKEKKKHKIESIDFSVLQVCF